MRCGFAQGRRQRNRRAHHGQSAGHDRHLGRLYPRDQKLARLCAAHPRRRHPQGRRAADRFGGTGLGDRRWRLRAGDGDVHIRDADGDREGQGGGHWLCGGAQQLSFRRGRLLRLDGRARTDDRAGDVQRHADRDRARFADRRARQQPDRVRRAGGGRVPHFPGRGDEHGGRGARYLPPHFTGKEFPITGSWMRMACRPPTLRFGRARAP